jgi:hypothetical protein
MSDHDNHNLEMHYTTSTPKASFSIPTSLLNVFYQLIKLSHNSKLKDGNMLLILWFTEDKTIVSVMTKDGDDNKTMDYCNDFQNLASEYRIKDHIQIEPASWAPDDPEPIEWFYRSFSDKGVLIQWRSEGIYISTSATQGTMINHY